MVRVCIILFFNTNSPRGNFEQPTSHLRPINFSYWPDNGQPLEAQWLTCKQNPPPFSTGPNKQNFDGHTKKSTFSSLHESRCDKVWVGSHSTILTSFTKNSYSSLGPYRIFINRISLSCHYDFNLKNYSL